MLQASSLTVSMYCLVVITFLTVCHARFKRGVVLGMFVNDRSIGLGVFRVYGLLNPIPIKGYVRHHFSLFLFRTLSKMMAVIEIEFLQGNNEIIIKDLAICADGSALAVFILPALSYGTSRF